MSGSTAWHNASRARLYLTKDKEDRSLLTLSPMKTNYGPEPDPITLRMKQDGLIVAIPRPVPFERFRVAHVDALVMAFGKEPYWRADPQSLKWGGFKAAEITDTDIGVGKLDTCSEEQTNNRAEIKAWLKALVRNGALAVEKEIEPESRKPRGFYRPGKGKPKEEDDG